MRDHRERTPHDAENAEKAIQEGIQIAGDWWTAFASGEGCPEGKAFCPRCGIDYATELSERAIREAVLDA